MMKSFELLSKKFFLFQNKYPAFYYKHKKVVFCYGEFIELPKKLEFKIKLPKVEIESKRFNPREPVITFITTKRCSMRCVYCSVRAGESSAELSFESAKLLIDKICCSNKNKKIKKLHIVFFGGEPTLSIKLVGDIIHYIKKKRITADYSLSTNGILNEQIIGFLKRHNFVVNLSFDGLPNIQNYLRPLVTGGESYNIVERTICEFVKKGIIFKVRATIVDDSIDQMLWFVKRLYNLGVTAVHFEPLNFCGRASDVERGLKLPDLRRYMVEYKKCIDFAAKRKIEIVNGVYDNLFSPNNDYCSAVTGQKIVLTPNGLITRCYEVQEKGKNVENCFIVGQILKNKLIIDQKKEKILSKILVRNREYCKNCFCKYICSGGCTIRTYRHILDPQVDLSYRCSLAKEMIADAIIRLWEQEKKIN